MKLLWLLFALSCLVIVLTAQNGQVASPAATVVSVNSAPTGSCGAGAALRMVKSTGVLYSCRAGAWLASLQVTTASAAVCDAAHPMQFKYVQGNATTKDTVQVCAHDSSNAYAWRTIY